MSLISMATNGLKSFASNIKNSIVTAVSQGISSYNSLMSGLSSTSGLINSALNLVNGLSSGPNGLSSSSAGNYKAGGNSRENSIYDYLSHFKSGIMKSSRFRAEFKLPKGVSGNTLHAVNTNAMQSRMNINENNFNSKGSINVKCHTATFPSRNIQTLDFRSNSVNFRIPWSTTYDPITLTFYADNNMDSREYFELWQSAVMNFGNNTSNFYNEYVSDIKLYLQDEYGADRYGVILYECYPVVINIMDVSYSTRNTPLSIMITLSYKSWLPMSNTNSFNRSF